MFILSNTQFIQKYNIKGPRELLSCLPPSYEETIITQIVGWEKHDPIHKMARTKRTPTHCHLR
jgi:hypothetical protein